MKKWRSDVSLDIEHRELLYEFVNEDGTTVRVRKGTLGNTNTDVVVTIYDSKVNDVKEKSIRHIYWVVDVLLKREQEPLLTIEFLNIFVHSWSSLDTFTSNKKEDIEKWIQKYIENVDLSRFDKLNNYGFLSVKTLYQILRVLSGNEKSALENAFMFRTIITRIAENDADLYDVIAWADFKKNEIKWENKK